jgi:Na+-driven multidrug efflux pump
LISKKHTHEQKNKKVAILVLYYTLHKRLYVDWWPDNGWSWSNITRARLVKFLKLYVPSALSAASDYWRVTAIGAVAATFGEIDVAVFNSSYRVMWIVMILAAALASAMSIRLNVCLGANQPINSKFVARVGIGENYDCVGGCVLGGN